MSTQKVCGCMLPTSDFGLTGFSGKYWNKRVLKVRFLDGDTTVQAKVQTWAKEWSPHCGITFDFGNHPFSDIRISFKGIGSWSYIGIDALSIPQSEPTMNFGWLTPTTADSEYSRVVLHEFGHALGFTHEHQNPTAGIAWNKPVVEKYYADTQGWDAAKVKSNVFDQHSASHTNFTAFDRDSIMLYAIPAAFTTNGFSVGWNDKLSATDRSFSASIYRQALDLTATGSGPPIIHQSFVTLGTRSKRYFNTDNGVGPSVQMTANLSIQHDKSDELWWIDRVAGSGQLSHGDPVFIRSRGGRFLNTDNGVGPTVQLVKAKSNDPLKSDEIWWVERIAGAGVVRSGDAILIRTRSNRYLNTDNGVGPSIQMTKNRSTDIKKCDEVWWIHVHG